MRTRMLIPVAGAVFVAIVAAGCVSMAVHVRYDGMAKFDQFRTFDWIPKPAADNPASDLVPGFRERVRRVLARLLTEKGLQQAPEGVQPDLHVVFYSHLANEERPWVSNWGLPYHPWYVEPWGYTWDAWLDDWQPSVEAGTVEIGTLVVDLVDAKTHKLVWRGWGRGVVDPGAEESELLDAARQILDRFPPSQAPPNR